MHFVFGVFILDVALWCYVQSVVRPKVIIKWLGDRNVPINLIPRANRCLVCPASSDIRYIVSTTSEQHQGYSKTFHVFYCLAMSLRRQIKVAQLLRYKNNNYSTYSQPINQSLIYSLIMQPLILSFFQICILLSYVINEFVYLVVGEGVCSALQKNNAGSEDFHNSRHNIFENMFEGLVIDTWL